MKKKFSLKLLAFLAICLMSVFCMQMPSPAYAAIDKTTADACSDHLNFCEAGCTTGDGRCFDCCWNDFVDCACPSSGNCRWEKSAGCPQS